MSISGIKTIQWKKKNKNILIVNEDELEVLPKSGMVCVCKYFECLFVILSFENYPSYYQYECALTIK